MSASGAKQRLMSEYKALQKEEWVNIDLNDGSLFRWDIALMVINPDSAFNGGYFKAEMTFTDKYPYEPPTFKFLHPPFHANVYADGKLCISILHTPGEDEQSGEQACERWSSVQSVESVLRSILLLLDDPETASAANVDAGVMYRFKRDEYNQKAREAVEQSKKDIPAGFVVPTTVAVAAPQSKVVEDDDFWAESGDEEDFGGSDSDDDMEDEDFEGSEEEMEETDEMEA
ncbi:ubiquitin-conjugating enzyme-2 [Coleophoma crateriformis]|uniref:Ubiquitin-conjugating enzyme-2 n=1 Tax=Coleophoma crateriformis TaxID=565419 RepID=A0A3D8R7W8_9HELO|nr:ubiquitin-conjugating enzyme-2 [Coleophoma crateriformis]